MPSTTEKIRGNRIRVRAVVFDYGLVLSLPQQPLAMEKMATLCGIELDRFSELYWKFRLPYDRADLDGPSYWKTVAREAGVSLTGSQIDELFPLDAWSWSRINPGSSRWVKQLHGAGFRMALLSNMPLEISRYLTVHDSWHSSFDHLVFSCDVRRVKPEPEIYHDCLKKLQAEPQEVLFLDDRPENVEAANRLGIHGVLFDTIEKTVARVAERFDVPAPEIAEGSPDSSE